MIRRSAGEIARLLAADLRGDPGAPVAGVAIDSRAVQPGNLFVALPGARVDGRDFAPAAADAGAAAVLLDRPLELDLPQIVTPDPLAALQRLATVERSEAAYRLAAVTGSIGKTTTKEFLTALLGTSYPVGCTSGNRNSETGFPVELCNRAEGIAWMVAELGMSHAGELDRLGAIAQPDAVLITVVAPVHLEFFPDIEAIAEAKAELIRHLNRDGTLVLNARDPRVAAFAPRFSGTVLRYGVPGASDLWIDDYQGRGLLGATFALAGSLGRVPVESCRSPAPQRHELPRGRRRGRDARGDRGADGGRRRAVHRRPAPEHREDAFRRHAPLRRHVQQQRPYALAAAYRAFEALAESAAGSRSSGTCASWGASARSTTRRPAGISPAARTCSLRGREVGPLAAAAQKGTREVLRAPDVAAAVPLVKERLRPGDALFVKGSRGVGLDRLVTALEERRP